MESNFAISFVIQILGATFVWKSDGFQIIDIISGGRFEEKKKEGCRQNSKDMVFQISRA